MIVTLTPNPSIDRTVTLASPLDARRRPACQLGDHRSRRQGRQHLAALTLAGVDTVALLPAPGTDPLVDRPPSRRGPVPVRPDSGAGADQPRDHRNGRHHNQDQQPGARPRRACDRRLTRSVVGIADPRPGWCWRVRCRLGCPTAGTPMSLRTRTPPAAGRGRHHRRPAGRPGRRVRRAAPDLIKPNGEELASFAGVAPKRWKPSRRATRPWPPRRRTGRPRRRRRAGHPGRRRRGAGHRAGAGRPRLPRSRRAAPSAPATPACSATSSATSRRRPRRTAAARRRLRQRGSPRFARPTSRRGRPRPRPGHYDLTVAPPDRPASCDTIESRAMTNAPT